MFNLDLDAVMCAGCGMPNMHPISLVCTSPGKRTGTVTVDHKGVSIENDTPPVGRGVHIAIKFGYEHCRELTQHTYHFAKGATFFNTGDPENLEQTDSMWPETIWRD